MGIHYGGLAGKARHLHVRQSADRHYSNQLIAEYYDEGGDEDRPMRVIPIRSRGEFLPSAMAFSTLDRRIGGQLSLPLNDQAAVDQEPLIEKTVPHEAQRAVARAPVATERLATEPRVEKPAVAASAANPNQARDAGRTQKNPTVIPFPRPARRSAASPVPKDWPGRSARRPTAPFTLRGFMTGFAVGSAAAALLLVFLNAAM